ncbi:MAG: Gmad2 immunoglobulin-like domain-containing protein [Candidatus Deferrimicrobiaceae bacterium]
MGALALLLVVPYAVFSLAGDDPPVDLPVSRKWSGDYPVAQLDRLPESQRRSRVGYLGDEKSFASVWKALKPAEPVPDVDFGKHLVVFTRNVDFYNRTNILKVTLKEGVAEILAMETRSALPIEEKVAMALAAIPRAGVRFLKAGDERIPVSGDGDAADPRNATYTFEGRRIPLRNGRHETEAGPGSAAKVVTAVLGEPAVGDLEGDGDEDAVLFLVHDPGGSGTFYYIAASINEGGRYRGTDAVLLGDRISSQRIRIRNGVVTVDYADRHTGEPMAAPPSVGKSKVLTLRDGRLAEIARLGEGEQVAEGWVTVGHEVRSFAPCSGKTDLWLPGNSPAMKGIVATYRRVLPDPEPYTPLFMTLAGRFDKPPAEGFGAKSDGAFFATQLLQVSPGGNCRSGLIVVDSPAPGARVSSPLVIRGRARGTWFFEGDFPVNLLDGKGNVLGKGYCTAKSEWMTKDFVLFEGTLSFEKPVPGGRGTLVLKKDNPSDLPEHDDALEIPLFFR